MGRGDGLGLGEIGDRTGDFDGFEIAAGAEVERVVGAVKDGGGFVTQLRMGGDVVARKRSVVFVTTFVSVFLLYGGFLDAR